MKNEKKNNIYTRTLIQLKSYGKIDYESLIKEFGLDPKLAKDGVHVRLMMDYSVIMINPEDDEYWEEVDRAIGDFKRSIEQ